MSNTIEQHNVSAEGYKALVNAVTTELTKAGYKLAIEVTQHTGGYSGSHEKTAIRVIFGESSNKAIDAYKAKIASAKANIADLTAKHNVTKGEFSFIDNVAALPENPFTAHDEAGNLVMTIRGGCTHSNGVIDTISYDTYNVFPNTDTKRSWDGSTIQHQRTSGASSASVCRWKGRAINPESVAKRLVKLLAENFNFHIMNDVSYAASLTSEKLAEERATVAKCAAEHANVKANAAFIAGLVPNSKVASVERKYRGSGNVDDVQIKINISLADVSKYIANGEQYPNNTQLLEAVVAMIKAEATK
jgi:hypothetical protein